MRKKKLLVWFLVVLMLLTSVAVLAGCKKPEEPEIPTVSSVSRAITEAFKTTYGYEAGKELSWDFAVDFAVNDDNYAIATKGNVSRTVAANNKFVVDIVKNDENIFKAHADDDFLYFDFGDEKYRYVDFDFAEMMAGDKTSGDDNLETVNPIIQAAFISMFETGTVDGNKYILSGSLPKALNTIVELLGAAGLEIPLLGEVISLIPSDSILSLSVVIDGGKCKSMNLDVTSSDSNFALNMTKANMSNTLAAITTPSKTDVNYVECQMFNYTMKGTFEMFKNIDRVSQEKTTLTWELRIDINPFDVLRNGLFSEKNDSMVYFNVSHVCHTSGENKCASFCDTKQGGSRGSIIDIVYDNRDFNNKINVALNTKYLIPQALMDEVNGLVDGAINLGALLPEYLGTNINPNVLNYLLDSEADSVGYVENNFNMGYNPVNLIRQILGIVSSVELNDNTLGFSIDQLLDLVGSFDNMGITRILDMFLKDINNVRINVDSVIHGDKTNETFKSFEKFLMVSEDSELKNFNSKGNEFNLSKEILGFEKDKAGNVKFGYNPNNTIYDADGKLLPVSKAEVEKMLDSGVIMNYLDTDGVLRQANVPIVDVKGMDYTKTGEQTVQLILGLTDGNSLGYLLTMISALEDMIGFKLPAIPGDLLEAKVTITPTKEVSFAQAEDAPYRFDPNKTYKFADKINTMIDVKVVYDVKNEDGTYYEKTTKGLQPNSVGTYVGNANNVEGEILYFKTFNLVYESYGMTTTHTVKMDETAEAKAYLGDSSGYNESTTVNLNTWTNTFNRVHVKYVSGKTDSGENIFTTYAGWLRRTTRASIDEQPNMEVSIDANGLIKLKFTKAGKYIVTGDYLGAKISSEFVVPYTAESVPSYLTEGKVVDGETLAVNFTRPNQLGNGLKVAFDVSVLKDGAMVALTEGQYELYAKDYNGEYYKLDKKPVLGKILPGGFTVYLKIIDPDFAFASLGDVVANVSIRAVDYDNFVIAKDISIVGNIYRNITFSAETVMKDLTHAEGANKTIKITSAAIDGNLYEGIDLSLKVYVSTFSFTTGMKTVELTAEQFSVIMIMSMFGNTIAAPIDLTQMFAADYAAADIRIMINSSVSLTGMTGFKVQLVDKGAGNKVVYEFNGTAE